MSLTLWFLWYKKKRHDVAVMVVFVFKILAAINGNSFPSETRLFTGSINASTVPRVTLKLGGEAARQESQNCVCHSLELVIEPRARKLLDFQHSLPLTPER